MKKRNPLRRNLVWLAWASNMERWHGEICDAVESLPSPQREAFDTWDANRARHVATSDWPGFRGLVRSRPAPSRYCSGSLRIAR